MNQIHVPNFRGLAFDHTCFENAINSLIDCIVLDLNLSPDIQPVYDHLGSDFFTSSPRICVVMQAPGMAVNDHGEIDCGGYSISDMLAKKTLPNSTFTTLCYLLAAFFRKTVYRDLSDYKEDSDMVNDAFGRTVLINASKLPLAAAKDVDLFMLFRRVVIGQLDYLDPDILYFYGKNIFDYYSIDLIEPGTKPLLIKISGDEYARIYKGYNGKIIIHSTADRSISQEVFVDALLAAFNESLTLL